jgi:creatinine amidohydrolase
MEKQEMRTRFLPKMTNGEVEQYLERNDIIFVPVGTVETHGALPLDCETVLAEAFALKMAEAADGLVLPNLPYFYAGATPVGRGTVQMSIRDGIDYLDKIAHSLLNQGFRRQVYVTLHGPAYLTVSPMVRDFFDKTKVPILYIDMITALNNLKDLKINMFEKFNEMLIGGYSLLGKLEEVPLNISESASVSYDLESVIAANTTNPSSALSKLAYQSGAVGFYFDKPSDHTYTPLLKTAEERESYAKEGIKTINEIVEALDMPKIVDSLREVDQYTKDISLPKYGAWLPFNK